MQIDITLTKKQREFDESIEDFPVTLYGGSRGGGKSYGLRAIMLKRRFEYPGSIGYIFRKTYPELEANHISPLFELYPGLKQYYNEGKKNLRLPNGSQLRFAVCESRKDLAKFQGREIHDLGIEEAGDWLFEHYELLRASNRSSVSHIKPRTILTANPGGIGHRWLKRLFIERKFETGENPKDYNFVAARVRDNPALLKADPHYATRLASIKNEMLRRAWLDGDWDVAAGQFFGELNRSIHMVKPFPIPPHWQWFGSYDYGYNHPASWGFWVCDEDGNIYRVKEIIEAKMRIDQQAKKVNEYIQSMIKTNQKKDKSIIFWAGHDCWAHKKAGDPTIAEEFQKHEIFLKRANIDRVQGASQMRMYLAHDTEPDGTRKGPRLFYFDTCEIGFDCLSRMTHNPDNPEDVLKVDAVDGDPFTGDDSYDEARYGIMSRPSIATVPKKKWRDRYDGYSESKESTWQTV